MVCGPMSESSEDGCVNVLLLVIFIFPTGHTSMNCFEFSSQPGLWAVSRTSF